MKKIVIFCSASNAIQDKYNVAAASLVKGLCAKGYGIVSGATIKGTMRIISDAIASVGGYHKGVLPMFMEPLAYKNVSETVWTESMSTRKEEMRKDTVAAIALPGGIGTLDELIETMTLQKLDKYSGRLVLFNYEGFYNPLLALLDHYVATGMLAPQDRALIEAFDTEESLLASF